MSRHTRAQGDGSGKFALEQHETDSPLLPVAQLEQLNAFKPEAVDVVLRQTEAEANYRRSETRRVNTFRFIEMIVGQIGAVLVAGGGIAGGIYCAIIGQPILGGTVVTVAMGTLSIAFIQGRSKAK